MKKIPFSKYQGAGNDFVMIDNRSGFFPKENQQLIEWICKRRFGVGADGLILLEEADGYDFRMVYYNSDGRESSMCGNGGRCIAAFARELDLSRKDRLSFIAIDGPHEAILNVDGTVSLHMSDVESVEVGEDYFLLNTGSPHYVVFVEDLRDINVVESARVIRYGDRFRKEGVNVNFVEPVGDGLKVYTYERGVEDETLACGTGVTAAALAAAIRNSGLSKGEFPIEAKGGKLKVSFEKDAGGHFKNIWLTGPAVKVFGGWF
ncbi:MAG: diaminopimelate epimerase [Saprospirales bacterium]|nr:diaminopimelate epimerase [Saprospirales bacterium]